MAAAVAAVAAGTVTSASVVSSSRVSRGSSGKRAAGGVPKLSLHGGLKAQNDVMAMGLCLSTEQQFANVRARCSAKSSASSKKGGALASTCDVASEILTVIPIMSALVLIGIAIGFVLLRVEAAIEESE